MGSTDDDTAAGNQLSLLNRYFRQHAVTGPEGHSFVSSAPRSAPTVSAAPADLAVVDHIAASVAEVAEHTRDVNPEAGPLPPVVDAIYDWYVTNTRQADERQRQRGETIVYRQQLEHAIAMGDTLVVRPHRCPACDTLGLHWSDGKVRCLNGNCARRNGGVSHSWSLAEIAYEYVASKKRLMDCAT